MFKGSYLSYCVCMTKNMDNEIKTGEIIRGEFQLGLMDRLGSLVVIAPARKAGGPGSNPGPGENFLTNGYSES